jgi:hypothetical protein
MSKRCELQKEYYQTNGNYKGNGKYCDKYVSWLEDQILALRIHDVVSRRELLVDFAEYSENDKTSTAIDECVDNYLDSIKQ